MCILCGRFKNLKIGQNSITLTDDKISFGSSATLTAVRQLGFDANNRLIYRDSSGVQTVAKVSEIESKFFTEIVMAGDVTTTGPETAVVDSLVSFDWTNFTRYDIIVVPIYTYSYNFSLQTTTTAVGDLIFKVYFNATTAGITSLTIRGIATNTISYGVISYYSMDTREGAIFHIQMRVLRSLTPFEDLTVLSQNADQVGGINVSDSIVINRLKLTMSTTNIYYYRLSKIIQ